MWCNSSELNMPTCEIMVHSANYVNVMTESDQGHTKTKKGLKVKVIIYRMTNPVK